MAKIKSKKDWYKMDMYQKLEFLMQYSMKNDIISFMKDLACIEMTNEVIFELAAESSIPSAYIDAIAKMHNYDLEMIEIGLYNLNFKSCLK